MNLFQSDLRRRRLQGALFAVAFLVAALLTAFFHTQVVAGSAYAARSEENRLRGIPIPAPRDARPHDLLEVAGRASFAQAAALEERRSAFPNLILAERPERHYPSGAAVGHLAGYVTEITREQLERPGYREAGYRQGRLVGQAGIDGSDVAPLAAKVANHYLDRLHGHPFDPEPTLGERRRAGRPPAGGWDPAGRRLVPAG